MKASELKKKIKGKEGSAGCLCCPSTHEELPMETKLYSGFGGWTIIKDGNIIFHGDDSDDWDKIIQLNHFEQLALKDPDAEWIAHLYLPLREAKYQRSDCGRWILIETGEGFA